VVSHLETTAASSSGGGAGPTFTVSLLGVDDKRGSNRGNDKSRIVVVMVAAQAFIVGLLDVDNKRGGNRGNRATSQGGSKVPLSLSQWQAGSGGGAGPVCCRPAWRRGQGQEGQTATG
jgi:hypothetical protein